MGRSSGGPGHGRRQGAVPPWIFINGTDIVGRGLMVLFSVFFVASSPPPPTPTSFSSPHLPIAKSAVTCILDISEKCHQNNVKKTFILFPPPPIQKSGYANGRREEVSNSYKVSLR